MLASVTKPKTRTPARAPVEPEVTQLNMRLPRELMDAMDSLVSEINERRPWPKMSRSDLIRIVMGRVVAERPEWLLDAAK